MAQEKVRVIIVVEQGCAEVYEAAEFVDVQIVDKDGDYAWLCQACSNVWGDGGICGGGETPNDFEMPDNKDVFALCPECTAMGWLIDENEVAIPPAEAEGGAG